MVDEVWEAFRRASVRITTSRGVFDIVPTVDDRVGDHLPGVTGPIHILTAQNPMGLPASDAANVDANRRLADELDALVGVTVWPAIGYGGGPIDAPGTWAEHGYAIEGLDDPGAVALATRYRQRAIFTWRNEPGGFRLVACDGSVDESRGWTITPVPDSANP